MRAGAKKCPTFAAALVVDGRYLCSHAEHRRERVDTVRAGAAKGPTFAAALVVDGRYLCARVACELGLVGLGWFGLVWVGLLGCLVAGGYDVWLFEVDVGVGVELWRRLWCLLCFTVGRVLCAG